MPGRLLHSPARVVQELLILLDAGSDPESGTSAEYDEWPVFRGREPDRPDDLVKVSDTTGIGHGDTQVDSERQEHDGIQVMVRSADYDNGFRKINEVCILLDRVNRNHIALDDPENTGTGGITYQVAAITRTSGPAPTGPDTPQGKRLTFTANFIVALRLCG